VTASCLKSGGWRSLFSAEGRLDDSIKNAVLESPEELIKRLDLRLTDVLLLTRALTHRSYLNEHPEAIEDNERLEFLGDAVLDFVVGAWLYNRYPEMPEGDLTRMRSALVHTEQLAEFAKQIGLGHAMRLGRGEFQAGGSTRPGLLCDTFEAVVGAIYLNTDIDGVLRFITPFLEEASEDILINHKDEDPKSKLQEWSQAHGFQTPQYVTCNSSGPDHSKVFEVEVVIDGKIVAKGNGHSKQAATKNAAQNALICMGLTNE
jgi:ribonuclease-3